MKNPRSAFLFVVLVLLTPFAASAREVRFPEKGLPAFAFLLPDDWTTQEAAEGNMLLLSPNRHTVIVINMAASADAPDKVAQGALVGAKAPEAKRKEPAEISGCPGVTLFSEMTNATGVHMELELTVVKADPAHCAAATLILADGRSNDEAAFARLVRNGMKILPAE